MNVDSKSNKLTANFSTGMLMRVGSKERLEKCYREKNLSLAARQTGLIMHKTGILSLEIILSAFLLM